MRAHPQHEDDEEGLQKAGHALAGGPGGLLEGEVRLQGHAREVVRVDLDLRRVVRDVRVRVERLVLQEAKSRVNTVLQENVHRGILQGVRHIV